MTPGVPAGRRSSPQGSGADQPQKSRRSSKGTAAYWRETLPYAGITQVRFDELAASVGPLSQPGSPGTPSKNQLLRSLYHARRLASKQCVADYVHCHVCASGLDWTDTGQTYGAYLGAAAPQGHLRIRDNVRGWLVPVTVGALANTTLTLVVHIAKGVVLYYQGLFATIGSKTLRFLPELTRAARGCARTAPHPQREADFDET